MRSWILFLSLCLALTTSPSLASAQGAGLCADERATLVDVRYEELGAVKRCGVGIKLFGFSIAAFGPRCPEKKVTYPAHATCQGERSVGNWCTKKEDRPVLVEACACDDLSLLGSGLALPSCSCQQTHTASTLEHFETRRCVTPPAAFPLPGPTEPGGLSWPWPFPLP